MGSRTSLGGAIGSDGWNLQGIGIGYIWFNRGQRPSCLIPSP